jgi:hypothetical protein
VCNNKFLQAVAEGLQAVETFHEAQGTIDTLVENLDDAVSRQTGKLRVRANRVTEADEDLPLGLISILVCAADRQREVEVCEMRPARAGYPIAVRSFSNAQTWCPGVRPGDRIWASADRVPMLVACRAWISASTWPRRPEPILSSSLSVTAWRSSYSSDASST